MSQNKNSNVNKMPSSKEVAALAQVSQATVSRVFSGHKNITEKTRRRVLEAAEKLGYRPNAMARSLTLNRSNLIALVTIDVVNPHYNAMINMIADRVHKIGRELLYFVSEEEKNLDEIIAQVFQYRVDGIIVHSAAISPNMAAECEKNQIPVVVFNKYTVNKNVMTVCSDNVRAGWMAANHFYDKGCRNFAFIGSHTFLSTSKDRLRGFTDALYEKGIENCISKMVPYTYKAGAATVREILNEQKDIDAIFCAGDLLALGAMDAIKYEYGLKIPEDIAIIGFDNIEAASWPPYTLTTFEQQIDKMLDSAFNYLSKKLNGEAADEGVELFECALVERNTA